MNSTIGSSFKKKKLHKLMIAGPVNSAWDPKNTRCTIKRISTTSKRSLSVRSSILLKNGGFCALFMGPANVFFRKNNFKNGSHDTNHTSKNYFGTIFLVFSFQQ